MPQKNTMGRRQQQGEHNVDLAQPPLHIHIDTACLHQPSQQGNPRAEETAGQDGHENAQSDGASAAGRRAANSLNPPTMAKQAAVSQLTNGGLSSQKPLAKRDTIQCPSSKMHAPDATP